jgi:hypothetical protein
LRDEGGIEIERNSRGNRKGKGEKELKVREEGERKRERGRKDEVG